MAFGKSVEEINRILVKFAPEMASDYAKYPLSRNRWYGPGEKGDNGEPCYLASASDAGMKMDYVFGRGPCGLGYYSLLTKTSYINLYSRVANEPPVGCCNCSKEAKIAYDEWDDAKRIIFNRQRATKPDDNLGARQALGDAQGIAQANYHVGQITQTGLAHFSGI